MSRRSDAARRLAGMLVDEAGMPVEVEWSPGRGWGGPLPAGTTGRWVVRWTDGPTVAALQARTEELVAMRGGLLVALRQAALGWERSVTDRAVALAVLDLAREGRLSADREERRWQARIVVERDLTACPYPADRPVEALIAADVLNAAAGGYGDARAIADLLAERGRAELGITDWPQAPQPGPALRGRWVWGVWPVPGMGHQLIERRPRPEPEAPVEATKPRDETRDQVESPAKAAAAVRSCPVCGGPAPAPAGPGRPATFCSPACRKRAHRATRRTEPQDEIRCEVCGQTRPRPAVGRPGRYCSPACRRRAWAARHQPAQPGKP